MTPPADSELLNTVLQLITDQGPTGLVEGLRLLINEAMRGERSQVLQAQPYQHTEARLGPIPFDIPQIRGDVAFYPSALQKGLRSEPALKLALAEMYVQGVSTRKVAAIVEELCGTSVSSTQVSECTKLLDAELKKWRERPLGRFPYLVLDARYEKVRQNGQLLDCAVLLAMGVNPDGRRSLLGVSVALSEAEVHWRTFLQSLNQRGLDGVQFIVSDDHVGLKAARTAVFPAIPWQRCQFHLQQNAQAYVPRRDQREEIGQAIRSLFASPDRAAAEQRLKQLVAHYAPTAPNSPLGWRKTCPKALPCSPCRWPTRNACAPPMPSNA
jgi:transposase-like protein